MRILVVSHGNFAKGLVDTVINFFGAKEIYIANITLENGNKELIEKVEKYINDWGNEQIIILTDIKGGSSTQSIIKYITNPNIRIITGVNLGLLIQLSLLDNVTNEELNDIIREAKQDITLLDLNQFVSTEDDE